MTEDKFNPFPENDNEFIARQKPIILYRGYVPTLNNAVPRMHSTIDIQKLAQDQKDPHDPAYADNLIWATPRKEFAQGILLTKTLIKMALDEDYRMGVTEGNIPRPSLATYKIGDQARLWNASERTLHTVSDEVPYEVVIQEISDDEMGTEALTDRDMKKLIVIGQERNMSETLARGGLFLDRRIKSRLIPNEVPFEELDGLTFLEGIKRVHDAYVAKGLEPQAVQEALANGFLTVSTLIANTAQELNFEEKTLSE